MLIAELFEHHVSRYSYLKFCAKHTNTPKLGLLNWKPSWSAIVRIVLIHVEFGCKSTHVGRCIEQPFQKILKTQDVLSNTIINFTFYKLRWKTMIYRMPHDISKADSEDYGIMNVYLHSRGRMFLTWTSWNELLFISCDIVDI